MNKRLRALLVLVIVVCFGVAASYPIKYWLEDKSTEQNMDRLLAMRDAGLADAGLPARQGASENLETEGLYTGEEEDFSGDDDEYGDYIPNPADWLEEDELEEEPYIIGSNSSEPTTGPTPKATSNPPAATREPDENRQTGTVSVSTQSGASSTNAQGGTVSVSTQSGASSTNAQGGTVSVNTQPGAGIANEQGGTVSVNTQPGAGSVSTQPESSSVGNISGQGAVYDAPAGAILVEGSDFAAGASSGQSGSTGLLPWGTHPIFMDTATPVPGPTPMPTDTPVPTPTPIPTPSPTPVDRYERDEAIPYEWKEKKTLDVNAILPQYREIYEQNNDFVGWITIPGTNIDYPVVQCEDSDYYLKHDFFGNRNANGQIILDTKCDPYTPSYNLVISGHSMKSGKMFGWLVNYMYESYWKKRKIVYFDTLMEQKTYVIFAAFFSADYDVDEEGFRYNADIGYSLDARQWLREIKENELYDTGIDAEFGDEFLTLTTCNHVHHKDGRFVVVCRRLREGEEIE